jgi:hypothetical protein
MVLLLFAALGGFIGYRLGTSRSGFVTLAAVSLGASTVQIGHLLTTSDRAAMTMLPLVVGTVAVASMLLGGLARRTSGPSSAAQ